MSLIKKPNELEAKANFSCLIYGQPGIGKTTLALSASNPVLIDVDQGLYRVEKRYQKDSLPVTNYHEILDLLNSKEIENYDTIVFDTLGKLIDRISDYVAETNPKLRQANGQLTMQGWGQVKVTFGALVKLVASKQKTVIFVAHESEEKDGDLTKKRPDVSGSARKDIIKELDFMGYMEASGGKRTICFNPSDRFYAKNSVGLDGVIEIPDIKNGNLFMQEKVSKAISERRKQDNETMTKYEALKAVIDNKIETIKDKDTLDVTFKEISELEKIWDSKLYAWNKLQDKALELGFEFSSTTKTFISKKAA